MKKSKASPKTVQRTHTFTQGLLDLMNEMLGNEKKYGYLSASEIVRRGILLAYREQKPAYKDETAKGLMRQKDVEEKEDFESVPDKDFATETLKGMVVPDDKGAQWVLIHQQGNWINNIPLEGIKDWFKKHPLDVNYHLEKLKEESLEKALDSKYLKDSFRKDLGIVL